MDSEKTTIEENKCIDGKTKSLSYSVKGEENVPKLPLSYRIKQPDGTVDGQNGAPRDENEKVDQERTRVKKKLFLEFYEQIRVIAVACKKIDISDRQVRTWRREDKDFAEAVLNIEVDRNEAVKDVILGKIFLEHDGPTARWWMERKDPEFKPRSVTEVVTPTKTLKQLIDEAEEELNKQNARDNQQQNTADESGNNPVDASNQKQEGGTGAVLPKSCAEILLGAKDEKKPDIKSQAEGNK